MKQIILCLLGIVVWTVPSAQDALIHSHNDYQQAEPLLNALRNKVYSLEADVYLVNDTLKVAHDKNEISSAPSLASLYIQPIIQLFQTHQGYISNDRNYAPVLMIDIKANGEDVLTALSKLLKPYSTVFDRTVNPKAVQIVISGDRGDRSKWVNWPSFIFFDGRINEEYDEAQLKRIAFISDSYFNYARHNDSTDAMISQLVERAHGLEKLLRLWAIPDNPISWAHLGELGVDIINTDKVAECRRHFPAKSQ